MKVRSGTAWLCGICIVTQAMVVDAATAWQHARQHSRHYGRGCRTVAVRCPSSIQSAVSMAGVTQPRSVAPRPTAEQRALAAEMLATIADGRTAELALFEVGSQTLEPLIVWSRRLVETHRLICSDQETLRKAMLDHLQFMEYQVKRTQALNDAGQVGGSAQDLQLCKFHLAEARYWLASLYQPAQAPASAEQVAAGQQMLESIRLGESAHQALYDVGGATFDGFFDWSRRRVQTHQLIGTKGPELQKVLNDHLKSAGNMVAKVRSLRETAGPGGDAVSEALSQFYLAEANFWLASATSNASAWGLSTDQRTAAQAMVAAAERVNLANQAMYDIGAAHLSLLQDGSERWRHAQLLLATNRTEKLAAAQGYLARATKLHAQVKALHAAHASGGDTAALLACRFHLAEARYQLEAYAK